MFFGSQSGLVYALNARDGSVVWTYHAPGAVKASPTLVRTASSTSATTRATCRRSPSRPGAGCGSAARKARCSAAAPSTRPPPSSTAASSSATPTGASTPTTPPPGTLDWAVQTGAYVYASPAVTNAPGLGPTVYLGSYDGTFYALNARSGQIAWSFNAHGRISGSATIVGRTVYFADLGDHRTYGLGISTGRCCSKWTPAPSTR